MKDATICKLLMTSNVGCFALRCFVSSVNAREITKLLPFFSTHAQRPAALTMPIAFVTLLGHSATLVSILSVYALASQ